MPVSPRWRESASLCIAPQFSDFSLKKLLSARLQLYRPRVILDSGLDLTGISVQLCEHEECVVGIGQVADEA